MFLLIGSSYSDLLDFDLMLVSTLLVHSHLLFPAISMRVEGVEAAISGLIDFHSDFRNMARISEVVHLT